MNPVIGLDVSKGESHAQAFLDRGVPHGKIFRFKHDLEGLASFLRYIRGIEVSCWDASLHCYGSNRPLS